jgi:hypothetical protein
MDLEYDEEKQAGKSNSDKVSSRNLGKVFTNDNGTCSYFSLHCMLIEFSDVNMMKARHILVGGLSRTDRQPMQVLHSSLAKC